LGTRSSSICVWAMGRQFVSFPAAFLLLLSQCPSMSLTRAVNRVLNGALLGWDKSPKLTKTDSVLSQKITWIFNWTASRVICAEFIDFYANSSNLITKCKTTQCAPLYFRARTHIIHNIVFAGICICLLCGLIYVHMLYGFRSLKIYIFMVRPMQCESRPQTFGSPIL